MRAGGQDLWARTWGGGSTGKINKLANQGAEWATDGFHARGTGATLQYNYIAWFSLVYGSFTRKSNNVKNIFCCRGRSLYVLSEPLSHFITRPSQAIV